MIIDCVSDLHGHYPELEGGDLLIVAGDLTGHDYATERREFEEWLGSQKYKKCIFIAGNHDNSYQFDSSFSYEINDYDTPISYLCDSGTKFFYHIEGFPDEDEGFLPSGKRTIKIWGSPWTKTFEGMNPHCMAFTVDTEEELEEKWKLIPDDIDILITHSPSFGNYDWVKNDDGIIGPSVGSVSLWMKMLSMVPNLKLHITGHIHEAYGHSIHANGIHLVNASHVNEHYEPVNKPIRIIL